MEKSRETELLYQISLSIGSSLDLEEMLLFSLKTIMRSLNCSGALVLQHSRSCSDFLSISPDPVKGILWSDLLAIPRFLMRDKPFSEFMQALKLPQSCAEMKDWGNIVPFCEPRLPRQYFVLNLPGFGALILQKSGTGFEQSFLLSLQVVINKLAGSALACIRHKMLKSQIDEARQKEAKLSTMLDSIGDAVIVVRKDQKILRMNPVAEKLTGFSFSESVGRQINEIFKIINSKTREPLGSPVEKVLITGDSVELANHTSLIRKDNSELQISDSCAPIRDSNGQVSGVILIFRDISYEYQQREKLQRSEKYNRSLLEAIPDLIFVFNRQGVFLTAHAAKGKLILPPEKFIGLEFSQVLPEKVAAKLQFYFKKLLEEKKNQTFNYSISIDATTKDFECRLIIIDEERVLALSRDITEKRLAEEALKASEEKFRQISESMGEVFWLRSADNAKMLYVNPAYEKVWARSCDSLYENPESFIDSVHDSDKPAVSRAFHEYLQSGKFDIDFRIVRVDGDIRWVNARSFPVRDENGIIVRHTGIAVDITARRKAEEDLHEKSQELNRYFTSSLDLLCIADLNGIFRRLNPEWEKCLGWGLRELEGRAFMNLVHPDDVSATQQAMATLSGKNEVRNFVNRFRCKDGSYRFIQWRSTTAGDLIYAVARDITDEKVLEARLKRHDEIVTMMARLSTMFINIRGEDTDAKINYALENVGTVLDVDRVYVFKYTDDLKLCSNTYEWCNHGIEPQIDFLQDVPSDLLPWWTERMRNLQPIILKSLDELPPDAIGERGVLEPQGIKSLLVMPLSIEGTVDGFIGFDSVKHFKNWTQEDASPLELLATILVSARRRKEDEHKLRELNATLEKRVEKRTTELQRVQSQLFMQDKMVAIGQLAAGLAHEINNPVSFVATNFATLEENLELLTEVLHDYRHAVAEFSREFPQNQQLYQQLLDKEEDFMVDYILNDIPKLFNESRDGFNRITEIIKSMRTFARQDSLDNWLDYNLNEGIRETLVLARNAYKYNAKLLLDLHDCLPTIQANPGQINQVLLNLIVNAAQALDAGNSESINGIIAIKTWSDAEMVFCQVSDNGPGIPKEDLSRIFDPFFSTKGPGKGTGLGLSISFDIIVNKHKGQIIASNIEQSGACFVIALPIKHQ